MFWRGRDIPCLLMPYASMLEGNEDLQREQEVVVSQRRDCCETNVGIGDVFTQHKAGLEVAGVFVSFVSLVVSVKRIEMHFEHRGKCRPRLRPTLPNRV